MKVGDLVILSKKYEKWMLTEFCGSQILQDTGWTRAERVGIITTKNPIKFFVTWSDFTVTGYDPENLEVINESR